MCTQKTLQKSVGFFRKIIFSKNYIADLIVSIASNSYL